MKQEREEFREATVVQVTGSRANFEAQLVGCSGKSPHAVVEASAEVSPAPVLPNVRIRNFVYLTTRLRNSVHEGTLQYIVLKVLCNRSL
jgi:hypothetical protein